MPRLRAFHGYVVNPARADAVVAPAYDSLSPAERASFSARHPDNYLNVMRTREDYPGCALDRGEVLERNRSTLRRLVDDGCFVPLDSASVFIYRLSDGAHSQLGLVAELPVTEIDGGGVLRHEQTRAEHEELLVEYQDRVGASSSPVALAYRADPSIMALKLQVVEGGTPFLDTRCADGVRQELWRVSDPGLVAALCDAFEGIPSVYLTDGHHRTAAASRYVERLRREGRAPRIDGAWNHVLVALFPHDALRVLPFNRVVRDLGGLSVAALLEHLAEFFVVEPIDAAPGRPPLPERQGDFLMVVDEDCFRLRARDGLVDPGNPAAGLDVTLLQGYVLSPVLGIGDSRSDPRLEYVSGSAGYEGVNHLRASGWRIAFYCHPASVEDIMAVSDARQIMPPKSTCFEPKARSGLFLTLNQPL